MLRALQIVVAMIGVGILIFLSSSAAANGSFDVKPKPLDALAAQGIDTSLPSLADLAKSTSIDTNTRALALIAIGQSKNTSFEQLLLESLSSSDSDLRFAAIIGLREMGASTSTPALARQLQQEKDPMMRQATITALEFIGDPVASQAILTAATDDSQANATRVNALASLNRMERRGILQYSNIRDELKLVSTDAHAHANVRAMAAQTMAAAGDDQAVTLLVQTALDSSVDRWIQAGSVRNLQKLTGLDFGYFENGPTGSSTIRQKKALAEIQTWWSKNSARYTEATENGAL